MAEADDLLHQHLRLKIMAALYGVRREDPLDFSHLKETARATDGNLSSHLAALESAGYVLIEKDFIGKRPRTRVRISAAGVRAFRRHVEYLRDLVEEFDK